MAKGYLLSESDKRILSALIEREKRKPPRQVGEYNRLTDDALTPEVYLALTPVGGIPGLVEGPGTGSVSMDDVPGYADCDIHAVVFSPEPTMVDMGFTRQVLNLNTVDVPGDHWILVARDKFGQWYVAEGYGIGAGSGAASDSIDISGRSGSIADVTAAQFLRTTISGSPGAAVVTPDDASDTLPGDVSIGTQTLAGAKTFQDILTALSSVIINSLKTSGDFLKVWGTGATNPVILTSNAGVLLGGATNNASLEVYGTLLGRLAATLESTLTVSALATFITSATVNSSKASGEKLRAWGTGTTDPVILTNNTSVQFGGTTNSVDATAYGDLKAIGGTIFQAENDRAWIRAEKTGVLSTNKLFTFDIISNTDADAVGVNNISLTAGGTDKDGTVLAGITLKFKLNFASSDNVLMLNESGGAVYGHAGNVGISGIGGGGDSFSGGICYALGTGAITNLTYSGSHAATGDITPSTLTADVNDWAPTGL